VEQRRGAARLVLGQRAIDEARWMQLVPIISLIAWVAASMALSPS
jgi:hypothetical protein